MVGIPEFLDWNGALIQHEGTDTIEVSFLPHSGRRQEAHSMGALTLAFETIARWLIPNIQFPTRNVE